MIAVMLIIIIMAMKRPMIIVMTATLNKMITRTLGGCKEVPNVDIRAKIFWHGMSD